MKTGDMIVYTSADSVLQICGHEETFGLDELYRCCEIAREITMKDEWKVGRVIARPYLGTGKGHFKRTSNRHDYALKPYGRTVLDELKANNFPRVAFINKDDRQKQITHATSSFIQLYRQLEFVPEYAANYYTNPFFREYRSYMKQQEIYNSFLSYVNENKEFFSSKNPLSIYQS